jgi:phosphonoacetaldehyde hydrolase
VGIKAILFDVIGTTVLERGSSVVATCFRDAFREVQVDVSREEIQSIRGHEKHEAIASLLDQKRARRELTDSILQSFKKNFIGQLGTFSENPDLRGTISLLKSKKILIGIGTGLPEDVFNLLFNHFNWGAYQFDYVGISENLGKGRPDPAMIHDMMAKLDIDPAVFLKVGDTPADISEGKNAGVKTAAILSGTCPLNEIQRAQPDYIIDRLNELSSFL